ncbi:MAG: hypothetical protein GEU92_04570 [Alphaproteobacteria bacterium]|nr:hypothetical protein [Alphaproteobacteria bacterium]
MTYDPDSADLLNFAAAVPAFADGSDTPRAWLERCIETIEARAPEVKAFVTLNLDGARKAADASSERYKTGRALGPVDGIPLGVQAMGFYRTDYDLVALARWLGGTTPGAA